MIERTSFTGFCLQWGIDTLCCWGGLLGFLRLGCLEMLDDRFIPLEESRRRPITHEEDGDLMDAETFQERSGIGCVDIDRAVGDVMIGEVSFDLLAVGTRLGMDEVCAILWGKRHIFRYCQRREGYPKGGNDRKGIKQINGSGEQCDQQQSAVYSSTKDARLGIDEELIGEHDRLEGNGCIESDEKEFLPLGTFEREPPEDQNASYRSQSHEVEINTGEVEELSGEFTAGGAADGGVVQFGIRLDGNINQKDQWQKNTGKEFHGCFLLGDLFLMEL